MPQFGQLELMDKTMKYVETQDNITAQISTGTVYIPDAVLFCRLNVVQYLLIAVLFCLANMMFSFILHCLII